MAVALLVGLMLAGAGLRYQAVTRDWERKKAGRVALLRLDGERTLIKVRDHLLDGQYTGEDDAALRELRASVGPESQLAYLRDRARNSSSVPATFAPTEN